MDHKQLSHQYKSYNATKLLFTNKFLPIALILKTNSEKVAHITIKVSLCCISTILERFTYSVNLRFYIKYFLLRCFYWTLF